MTVRNVCLIGGPPWGLRFAPAHDGCIRVTQVLANGKADREGVRVGDILESVNGQCCHEGKMLHSLVRSVKDVLRFRLKRKSRPSIDWQYNEQLLPESAKTTAAQVDKEELKYDGLKHSFASWVAPKLTTITESAETTMPLERPRNSTLCQNNTTVAGATCVNRLPSCVLPLSVSDFMDNNGYNGELILLSTI